MAHTLVEVLRLKGNGRQIGVTAECRKATWYPGFVGRAVMSAWQLQLLAEAVRVACADSRPKRRGLGQSSS